MRNFFYKSFIISLVVFFSFYFLPASSFAAVPTLETNPGVLGPLSITSSATTGSLARMIMEFLFKLATENLKRTLLDALVSQMVTGIAGGSEPKFVTNWESFLNQNYSLGREEALSGLEDSEFFSSGNNFDSSLQAILSGSSDIPEVAEKTDEEKYNEQYEKFDWERFAYSSFPENNFYGKYYIAQDTINRKAAAKAEAAKNEALAGGGFLSTKDANGNISTPGKTIGDTLSRAVTSDIDYIVNADDFASFVSAISSSVFNKLLNSEASGIIGVAQGILSGENLGTFSLGEFGSVSLEDISEIIFDENSDNDFSSAYDSIPKTVESIDDLIKEEIENTANLDLGSYLDSSSNYDSLYSSLGSYKQNKISSFNEVKRAILYLEDINLSLNLTYSIENTDTGGSSEQMCSEDLFYFLSVSERKAKIDKVSDLKTKLQTLLQKLDNEISASSGSETEAEILASSLQKEELSNLFLAGNSSINEASENFDLLNTLPLNLNVENGLKVDNKTIKKNISCSEKTVSGTGLREKTTTTYYTYETSLSLSGFNFFNNEIKYTFNKTTSGYGNYLGLSLSSTVASNFFYLHPDNFDNYLSSLSEKISSLDSLSLDSKSLSRKISFRQNKEAVVSELNKAYLYLEDVDSSNSNLSILKNNLLSKSADIWKTDVSEADLDYSQKERAELLNLFSAGLGSESGNNFDITNKLPINLNQKTDSGSAATPVSSGNIKTTIAPFSASQNFLGLSINLVYFNHFEENKESYLEALNSKINNLKQNGYLK
ncbi:MAG: hypothetical protein PHZ25_00585 [Candidatus Pacebacteria bacterium]|nr:hypothetical protein [Candidatus Paceibacterota bacterium]